MGCFVNDESPEEGESPNVLFVVQVGGLNEMVRANEPVEGGEWWSSVARVYWSGGTTVRNRHYHIMMLDCMSLYTAGRALTSGEYITVCSETLHHASLGINSSNRLHARYLALGALISYLPCMPTEMS